MTDLNTLLFAVDLIPPPPPPPSFLSLQHKIRFVPTLSLSIRLLSLWTITMAFFMVDIFSLLIVQC